MFDGAILDVAIGMLLLFLVASLIASALVETVGGFLHRRSKHLWDTIDLLLGNTSAEASLDGQAVQSIVAELYQQPFITGLVRPTDRLRFDPGTTATPTKAPVPPKKLPIRARAQPNMKSLPMGATGNPDETALRRRFYGPDNIDAREFTNALLAFLRPDGQLDKAAAAITAINEAMPAETDTDVAIAEIAQSLDELRACGEALGSKDFSAAIDSITNAGDTIRSADLRAALEQAQEALKELVSGTPTTENVVAALQVVPTDLRVKLLAVANEVADDVKDIRTGIEEWYDRNMAAASRWYRKQTRYFLFLAGIVMAISLNVDAVYATTTLYRDESVRDSVVAIAEQVSAIDCDNGAAPATTDAPPTTDAPAADETDGAGELDLECLRTNVGGTLALPIGWADIDTSAGAWGLRILGWLIVAGSVTLGAPFWFDLLGRALAKKKK